MLYRICTENVNKDKVVKLASQYFDGFTVIEGQGYWKGTSEASLIIEYICNDETAAVGGCVHNFAKAVRGHNKQECVLIQAIKADSILI